MKRIALSSLLQVSLGTALGSGCDPFCGTEDIYDVEADVEIGGVLMTARVVHEHRVSRSWCASMNSAGCKYADGGEVMLFEPPGGGLVVLPVQVCRRPRGDTSSGPIDLLEACMGSTSAHPGWILDSGVNPTRWREVEFRDGVRRKRMVATPSWSWWPSDEIDAKAPGLQDADFLDEDAQGNPVMMVQSPYLTLEATRGCTAQPKSRVVYDASLVLASTAGVTP